MYYVSEYGGNYESFLLDMLMILEMWMVPSFKETPSTDLRSFVSVLPRLTDRKSYHVLSVPNHPLRLRVQGADANASLCGSWSLVWDRSDLSTLLVLRYWDWDFLRCEYVLFFSRKKSSGYCLHINQRAGGDKSRVLAPEADLSAELSSGNHQSKERGAQGASFLDGSAALHQLLTTAAEVLPKLQKLTPRVRAVQGGLAQVLKEAKAIRLEGSQAGEVEWLNIAHRETIFIQSFCIHFGSWGLPGSPRSPRGWASQGWKEAAALLKWEWQTAVCWC